MDDEINDEINDNVLYLDNTKFSRFLMPLEMIWKPKEDITTFELAQCLPLFFRPNGVMPYEISKDNVYLRHFDIIDHNEKD